MDLDKNRIAEGAMAILALTLFSDGPVHVLDDLYRRGWIHDPRGKAKSVVFTDEGHKLAVDLMQRQFGVPVRPDASSDAASPRT